MRRKSGEIASLSTYGVLRQSQVAQTLLVGPSASRFTFPRPLFYAFESAMLTWT